MKTKFSAAMLIALFALPATFQTLAHAQSLWRDEVSR